MKRVIKAANKRGWKLTGGSKHHILVHPSGRKVSFSSSPSCVYAFKNVQKDIEKVELEISEATVG